MDNRMYIINHDYGKVKITGLRNALNIYRTLYQYYWQTSDMSLYHEVQIEADLEKNGYHEERYGYIVIDSMEQDLLKYYSEIANLQKYYATGE